MLGTLAGKRALADGVLDHKGDLQAVPMQGSRQAFLAKLQQLMADRPAELKSEIPSLKPPLPADRPMAFARSAQDTISGALVRCEERYPSEAAHTVLLVVVDESPAQHRNELENLHQQFFGPGISDPLAPVQLEVIDRATDEALQRLMAAGLIQTSTPASRPLFPAPEGKSAPPALSDEERARADAHRTQAARKLKMARLLGEGGLEEEACGPLLEAALAMGCALAVEQRTPVPSSLDDALLPPLSPCWEGTLPVLRQFTADSSPPWRPVAETLNSLLARRLRLSEAAGDS